MQESRTPQVGDKVEVHDGRPNRARATVIRGTIVAVHDNGIVDIEAVRPVNVGTREGDREGDKYTLTNQVYEDGGDFRTGQWRYA